MTLDKNMFGNYEASHNLVAILEELNNKKLLRLTSNFLIENFSMIKKINTISNLEIRVEMLRMFQYTLKMKYSSNTLNLPEKIRSHSQAILFAKIRDSVRLVTNKNGKIIL